MKPILKRSINILLFSLLLVLFNCQKDDVIAQQSNQDQQRSGFTSKKVDASQIESNTNLSKQLNSIKGKLKTEKTTTQNKSVYSSTYDFIVDTDFANYIESLDSSYHSYTFPVYRTFETSLVENLLLTLQEDGTYGVALISYDLTSQEKEDLSNGIQPNYEGKIATTVLENFNTGELFNKLTTIACLTTVHTSCGGDISQENSGEDDHPNGYLPNGEECPAHVSTVSVYCTDGGGYSYSYYDGEVGYLNEEGEFVAGSGGVNGSNVATQPFYSPQPWEAVLDYLQLDLNSSSLQFLIDYKPVASIIEDFLDEDSSTENQTFIRDLLEVISLEQNVDTDALHFVLEAQAQDKVENNFDSGFFYSVDQFTDIDLSDSDNHDPVLFHYLAKCAMLRSLNPEWSNTKILWEASKDVIHISLDIFGLVPVIGEIADLANGVLYAIEGDGVNASLSVASAVPFLGYGRFATKYGLKIVEASTTLTKVKLVWKVTSNGIEFGRRSILRKVLGMAPYAVDARQAHHIIPWGKRNLNIVQQAARDPRAFHMNEALNGIPLNNSVHLGSHTAYDTKVIERFNQLNIDYPNITPSQAYDGLMDIISDIKTAIQNNPTTHVNNLVF